MENEVLLLKGNEAIAHAAIRCGCDGYFGYPITPQSEVLETLAALMKKQAARRFAPVVQTAPAKESETDNRAFCI